MAAVCGRALYSQQPVEKKRRGEGHTLPHYWPPAVPPRPRPLPAPLPGDEWWYSLKVKPAGELWLRLGGRQRQTQHKKKKVCPSVAHVCLTERAAGAKQVRGRQKHSRSRDLRAYVNRLSVQMTCQKCLGENYNTKYKNV